ncbi:MAG: hypothetical protein DRP74_03825 [Candidatus Omnitrophota bacterium]|nr:MAG: hypothetical protein DRP74_03825 [Candidatus Omnitrophota bacterium]
MRQIKTAQEVEEIKKGLTITISAFRFIKHYIIPGKKEIEVQAELERFIRYHGASNSAFETIVASGPNSSFPHHKAGERKLRMSEPVLIDFGVDYHGYKTDLTRVFFLGKITPAFRKIYNIVTRAHGLALRTIRPGVKISSIDKAARQYIKQSGYGGFFSHNLGHGVGREIHEEPHISEKEESLLKKGMVFTLEPAIYLPGKFGVRIEDMVLVREAGCEILSANLEK